MKKIKRTITVRKIEFIGNPPQNHDSKIEICPLCHSQIHVLPLAIESEAEESAAEIPVQLSDKREIVIKGDKNE